MFKNEKSSVDHLQKLLADERVALLSGDLGALASFIEAKETLVSSLDLKKVAPEAMESLRNAAKSNQALMLAALKGVQAARDRLEIARSGGASFNTYSAQGDTTAHKVSPSKIERRA